jgi:hypothetical protein
VDFDEAVHSIIAVVKEETGVNFSFEDGAPTWFNSKVRIKLAPMHDGLKVLIYDDRHVNRELHTNLTDTDVAITARTIVRELERRT